MAGALDRIKAKRVFEETLAQFQLKYSPTEDVMLEARANDAQGVSVVVARYKLYVDGRIECFELLDEALWPSEPLAQ